LCRFGQGAEAHIRDEKRYIQLQRFLGVRADDHAGTDRVFVEHRRAVQLRRQKLEIIPTGQFVAWHAHRRDLAVMAGLGQTVAGILLDQAVERLLRRAMASIGIEAEIAVPVERLRVVVTPCPDLVLIDQHVAAFDPGRELLQHFRIVIFGDSGLELVIPVVDAADQIVVAIDKPVGHQCAPVQAAPVKNRDGVIKTHDHQIDIRNERIFGLTVFKVVVFGDGDLCHVGSSSVGVS
jgi:hypothetical protein